MIVPNNFGNALGELPRLQEKIRKTTMEPRSKRASQQVSHEKNSYDGSSKVLFPLLALNRNSMRDAFCFTCKKSYTEDTSKMQ